MFGLLIETATYKTYFNPREKVAHLSQVTFGGISDSSSCTHKIICAKPIIKNIPFPWAEIFHCHIALWKYNNKSEL